MPATLTLNPIEFMNNSYTEMVEACRQMRPSDMEELRKQLDAIAARAAFMSSYLDVRYGSCGSGDGGHDKALKQANRTHRVVRAALGYHITPQLSF